MRAVAMCATATPFANLVGSELELLHSGVPWQDAPVGAREEARLAGWASDATVRQVVGARTGGLAPQVVQNEVRQLVDREPQDEHRMHEVATACLTVDWVPMVGRRLLRNVAAQAVATEVAEESVSV